MVFLFVKNNNRTNRGFTVLEMMVVVAIAVIMTGIILANMPDMKSSISADLVAQDIAVSIRGAQSYTSKVGTRPTNADIRIYKAYEIQFLTKPEDQDNNDQSNTILLWGLDKGPGGNYYPPCSNCRKLQEKYILPSGYYIKKISCYVDDSDLNVQKLNIFFEWSDLTANFWSLNTATGNEDDCFSATRASIYLGHNQNTDMERIITVHKNGQIEVSK